MRRVVFLGFVLVLSAGARALADPSIDQGLSFYAARISEERTWQHVLRDPFSTDYADAWLVAGAYSRAYGESAARAMRREWEVNVAYNFGDQDHFELNVVPLTLRWQRFPWSERLHTTAAFGAGLSYAFGFPEVENELEGDTTQLLIFLLMEITVGPAEGPWSVVFRLHHRSTGFGVMGVEDGGMNAPGLGVRVQF